MPTISIVVPAYNAERTILDTIASVQQQTFQDFELIVINDGSRDRTLEVLDRVTDSRLKVFSFENAGVSTARNRGIALAAGDYIAFLDPDDLWTIDKLELQLQALQQHPEAALVYSASYFLDEQGQSFHKEAPRLPEGNVYRDLLLGNFLLSGSTPLIRKTALTELGGFDPSLTHAEDWDLWLRLAQHYPFLAIAEPQVFYRQSRVSASSKVGVMEQGAVMVLQRAFEAAPPELQNLKPQSFAYLYQYLAHLYLKRLPGSEGVQKSIQKLSQSIRLYPSILFDRKTQILLLKTLFMRVLTPQLASSLFQQISSFRGNRIPNPSFVGSSLITSPKG